ncbi:Uncharacterized protein PECH_008332 [Penicillium ucsense]|uniref:Cell division control protein n=1 Tax=Penicillium ucsense TaxID=2839758 RepID=A0A8J8WGJ4_9EURO|nr:Uncharacterized protein PECM_008159 [Penicillium ucsense]KAF7734231.1 Uncharacterized protein PECH_008332 [Penicillium ucsense]
MPGTVADGPTVSMSFANNFWGKDDAGLQPMLDRMHASKVTSDELKVFYNLRSAIEDEYSRKLQALCRKSLGSAESGSLRSSLDVVRGETEAIAKSHAAIAGQMKTELEEPLTAFSKGIKERRKIIQDGIERLHKTKMQQTQVVNKTRDRFEQDCLRIKGYLAQGHMVMGQEERKNKAKLEKAQIQLASNSSEYEAAVKVLEETTGRWNKEWKAACDKFQDLEEERLDFTKSSLWTYANIASTVCVSDDASCEKIRLSLEDCEVEKDIVTFIKERGTGQEIPDAPRFINFCKEDDDVSDIDDDGYSVAQFQRAMNPSFRTSSPQPSTFESHHDPNSELAAQMGHPAPEPVHPEPLQMNQQVPPQMEHQMPPQMGHSAPPQPSYSMPPQMNHPAPQQPMNAQPPAPLDLRRGGYLPPNYDPEQHGEINAVPHNAYPTDGMTMFCRTGPPSGRSSTSAYRPSSRDSHSEISNPTSMSSVEAPVTAHKSPPKPTNSAPLPSQSEDKSIQKKKSAFFSNSPFRRKSRHDKERPVIGGQTTTRSPWASPTKPASPTKQAPSAQAESQSPEPVDPRANFQLNVGNNVFDVASPDKTAKATNEPKSAEDDMDPIARALAELKTGGKQSTLRVSADRYHGIQSPTPSAPSSAYGGSTSGAPPAYNNNSSSSSSSSKNPPVKRLDAPQPAFTSKQMQKTTQKYTGQTQSMLRGANNGTKAAPPAKTEVPRARSPAPQRTAAPRAHSPAPSRGTAPRAHSPAPPRGGVPRARSPAPPRSASPLVSTPRTDSRMGAQYSGANSPAQSPGAYQSSSMRSRYSQSPQPQRVQEPPFSPNDFARRASPAMSNRAVSPQPQFRQQARPSSSGGMELQLSNAPVDMYGADSYGSAPRRSDSRPRSQFGDINIPPPVGRSRSRTLAVAEPGRKFSRDGRPILHFARAMYNYSAAIPEELGFTKGDVLAVIRLQDDGWWEAEITNARGHPGLVPSNYLQII